MTQLFKGAKAFESGTAYTAVPFLTRHFRLNRGEPTSPGLLFLAGFTFVDGCDGFSWEAEVGEVGAWLRGLLLLDVRSGPEGLGELDCCSELGLDFGDELVVGGHFLIGLSH